MPSAATEPSLRTDCEVCLSLLRILTTCRSATQVVNLYRRGAIILFLVKLRAVVQQSIVTEFSSDTSDKHWCYNKVHNSRSRDSSSSKGN
ncbi:hypothetical protein BCR37DRAFT_381857 [Protomyces lactucae-debilis]|uniref:Uncharacterized protein n=1 Tax=Protomyces lactucae-debilis TaxID=2754530 RepID=A0A1Y2F4Y3_PROLT|nr:uncharacterized protein BCR37DRAFT_381857 [Protomyces lactucae-debilis]ORY78978.1 hypothetical protein BCR37DRAFT_381857 [Protomyces lactucae-debilis]